MTITRDQAQMITTLAIACRPHRAPTWDAAGVMAALGKVHGLDLAEVIMATIRLARDRNAHTPADIAKTNSECWREQLKPPKWEPEVVPRQDRCGVCAHPRHDAKCPKCAAIDDHAFEPDVRTEDVGDIARTIDHLRDLVVDGKAPTEPTPKPELVPDPRADVARAAITTAACDLEETA